MYCLQIKCITLKSHTSLVALDGAPITNPISLVNAPVVSRRSARVDQSVLVKVVSVVVGQSHGQIASNGKLVGIHVHAVPKEIYCILKSLDNGFRLL